MCYIIYIYTYIYIYIYIYVYIYILQKIHKYIHILRNYIPAIITIVGEVKGKIMGLFKINATEN